MSEGADETPVAGVSAELRPSLDGPDLEGDSTLQHRRTSRRWLVAGLIVVVASAVAAVVIAQGDRDPLVASIGAAPIRTSTTTPRFAANVDDVAAAPSGTEDDVEIVATTSSTFPPVPTSTSVPPATAPPQDANDPAVVARPVPVDPPPSPPSAPRPAWADSTFITGAGLLSTELGCADDTSAAALDRFFSQRVGPILGWDYQHVVSLGANRSLWLFQDTFIDHSGTAATLDRSSFAHNVAVVEQDGCFNLLHQGTTSRPTSFEPGTGSSTLSTWFWPMGGGAPRWRTSRRMGEDGEGSS